MLGFCMAGVYPPLPPQNGGLTLCYLVTLTHLQLTYLHARDRLYDIIRNMNGCYRPKLTNLLPKFTP